MIAQLSAGFHVLTLALLACATVAALTGRMAGGRLAAVGRSAVAAAALTATAGLTLRTAMTGHLPIFGTFENTYTACWFAIAGATLLRFWRPAWKGAWRWAAVWGLALMAYGLLFRRIPLPLTISEQSIFVDLHVIAAWCSFVPLLGATTFAFLRLAGRSPLGLDGGQGDRFLERVLLFGFIALTAMIVLGSFYLYLLFATFWRWEIVGTLCLVAWVGYGMVLHVRLFYRWGGRRLDVSVASLLPVLLLSYWVWSVFAGTYHYFDIPLIKPY